MYISTKYKIHNVVGSYMLMLQGKMDGEMTRVISFNETSLMLFQTFQGKHFELADVKQQLLDNYEVTPEVAEKDAQEWIDTLKEHGIIE